MQFIDYKIYDIGEDDNEILKKNAFGDNQKGIIIVYSHNAEEFSLQNVKDFLGKIIHAIGFNLENDTRCIPITQETSCSFRSLNEFDAKHLFVFGLTPTQLGIQANVSPYQEIEIQNCKIFFADNLKQLSEDQRKKRQFWMYLKTTFLT